MPAADLNSHFHVGLVVPDLACAMAELGAALGVTWSGPVERDLGEWVLQVAFARTAPPYLELIQGPPQSVWGAAAGPHIHHVAFWVDDLETEGARLEEAGMIREVDFGTGRYYVGGASGLRMELLAGAGRRTFFERFELADGS